MTIPTSIAHLDWEPIYLCDCDCHDSSGVTPPHASIIWRSHGCSIALMCRRCVEREAAKIRRGVLFQGHTECARCRRHFHKFEDAVTLHSLRFDPDERQTP